MAIYDKRKHTPIMQALQRDTFCSYCGSRFIVSTGYPRECSVCENETYLNAAAIGVGLIEINKGLLVVQRAIPPRIGEWALPGGYKNVDETWEQGIAREVFEETGIVINPDRITLAGVRTAHNGGVLVFGVCERIIMPEPLKFDFDHETMAAKIIESPIETCFNHHTDMVRWFFDK